MHRVDARQLAAGLRRLGLRWYTEYTRSDWWRHFRARRRLAGMTACAACGSRARVSLHHVTYARLGRERPSDVLPLCRGHHKAVHRELDARNLRVTRTAEIVVLIARELGPKLRQAWPKWHWSNRGHGRRSRGGRK